MSEKCNVSNKHFSSWKLQFANQNSLFKISITYTQEYFLPKKVALRYSLNEIIPVMFGSACRTSRTHVVITPPPPCFFRVALMRSGVIGDPIWPWSSPTSVRTLSLTSRALPPSVTLSVCPHLWLDESSVLIISWANYMELLSSECLCLATIGYQPNFHVMYITSSWSSAQFCLAYKLSKQYFLYEIGPWKEKGPDPWILFSSDIKGTISSWPEQTFNRAWNRCPTLRWIQWLKITGSFMQQQW